MTWNIIAFESGRGEKPVEEFIKSQEPKTIAKIASEIDLLEQHGNRLGRPHAAPLQKGLFELRIRGKEECRILYAFSKDKIYLLHAFRKKSQKIPRREIEVAFKRLKSL